MDRPIKVLVLEDDPVYLLALQQTVDVLPRQFEIVAVNRLSDALARLGELKFDVVLLDLNVPDSDGIATFRAIHAKASTVPVIVLTGNDDEALALQAVREGAQEYLVKGQIQGRMLARIMRNAVERRQAELELREREQFFRLITENVNDLIAVLDRDGKRLYNSPSYRNLLGDPGSMRGTNSFAQIHPEDLGKIRQIFQETIGTGVGQRTEYRFLLPDGSVRYVESVGSVIKDEAGEPSKVVVVSRDMTEHRNAVERLRASEALYHSLVESLPQNIFRKDLEGRFTFANQRFCQTLGHPREEVLGRTDFDFFVPEFATKYQEDDRKVLDTGEMLETYEENQPIAGHRIDVHVVKIPIRDATGRIVGIQGIYWDISKQKRAEEQLLNTFADLQRSHEELKSAQLQLIQAAKLESVGTLAAGVAHEVKNPLQTILMGLDYLTRTCAAGDETARMVLTDMRHAVKRADTIVKGLLHYSANNQPDARHESLNAIIAQSLLLVRYELNRSHITVCEKLADDLPPVIVDRVKLEQVFINLFVNAIHAMPHGGTLTVSTRSDVLSDSPGDPGGTTRLLKGDRVVIAEVQDSGTGIAEPHLAKIFDPFFTTKPTGVGTGLGLPVSKKIIELHGGRITINNAPAGGVVATIVLKVEEAKP